MEKIVIYVVLIFTLLILAMSSYLLLKRITEKIKLQKMKVLSLTIDPLVDRVVATVNKREADQVLMSSLQMSLRKKISREIAEQRLIYHIEHTTGKSREAVIKLCEDIGLVDYVLKKLKSGDYYQVALACKKIGDFRSKKGIEHMLQLLDISNIDISYNILMALSKIGDIEIFAKGFEDMKNKQLLTERSLIEIAASFEGDHIELYKNMINSNDAYISTVFIRSAGNKGSSELCSEIAKYLNGGDKNKRIACIKAIGQIGDSTYEDSLISCLGDEEWEVRAMAAKSLGTIGNEKAIQPLISGLSDKEWWVRYNSAYSIANLPRGREIIQIVLNGNDKYAKEIMISALENT